MFSIYLISLHCGVMKKCFKKRIFFYRNHSKTSNKLRKKSLKINWNDFFDIQFRVRNHSISARKKWFETVMRSWIPHSNHVAAVQTEARKNSNIYIFQGTSAFPAFRTPLATLLSHAFAIVLFLFLRVSRLLNFLRGGRKTSQISFSVRGFSIFFFIPS